MLQKESVRLYKSNDLTPSVIILPASKSLSNRALIINALGGGNAVISNLSEARDTQTMQALLSSDGKEFDVKDAGTTMRFLTAYCTVTNQNKILTGTDRMCERPIGILVDALKAIGGNITYLNKQGYPPMETQGFKQTASKVQIQGNVSSQYISAMLMIAPFLGEGLEVILTGKVGSKPYIDMTLSLMKHFGVDASWEGNVISIAPQSYQPAAYRVEPDWSAASYWYSFTALANTADIILSDLTANSLQGDSKIAEIMEKLGVKTEFTAEGAKLTKSPYENSAAIDFTHCPDLAQTIAVVCAVKGITCKMTGLESLKIKETDRVFALQEELSKIGAQLIEEGSSWTLIPTDQLPLDKVVHFASYDDHRMAMAFAPLSTLLDIVIEKPGVVSKSYPRYWENLQQAGIKMD